ncbi:MAG: hypothetical protein HW389_2454 [Bacteroidetes bacterium]|nr:hypothetical protein [Bacteroidota bacterium]
MGASKDSFHKAFCGTKEREACHVMAKPYNTLAVSRAAMTCLGLALLEILTVACYAAMEHTVVLRGNHINSS